MGCDNKTYRDLSSIKITKFSQRTEFSFLSYVYYTATVLSYEIPSHRNNNVVSKVNTDIS